MLVKINVYPYIINHILKILSLKKELELKKLFNLQKLVWRLKASNIGNINLKAVTYMWTLGSKYTTSQSFTGLVGQTVWKHSNISHNSENRKKIKVAFHKNSTRWPHFLPCMNNVWSTMLFARLSNHQHLSKCLYKL